MGFSCGSSVCTASIFVAHGTLRCVVHGCYTSINVGGSSKTERYACSIIIEFIADS